MGSKYLAWPQCLVFCALLAAFSRRAKPQAVLINPALFLGASLLVMSPWVVRNIAYYRNPIYPFLHEYFPTVGAMPDWRALAVGNGRDLKAALTTWQGLKSLLMHPWTELTFTNHDVSSLGPLFLLGLPLLALVKPLRPNTRFVWAVFLTMWLEWALTSFVPRFFLAAFPLYFAALSVPIEHGFQGAAKKAMIAILVYAVAGNFFWGMVWLKTYEAEDVILGVESKSAYLSRSHPSFGNSYYPTAEHINAHLPATARILPFGEMRNFYLRREYWAVSDHIDHPLARLAAQSVSAGELREKLLATPVSHLLINVLEVQRLDEPVQFIGALPPGARSAFDRFASDCLDKVFEDRRPGSWTALYEISPCRPSGPARAPDPVWSIVAERAALFTD